MCQYFKSMRAKFLCALALVMICPGMLKAQDLSPTVNCALIWQPDPVTQPNVSSKVLLAKNFPLQVTSTYPGQVYYQAQGALRLSNGVYMQIDFSGASGFLNLTAGTVEIRSGAASANSSATYSNYDSIATRFSNVTTTYITPQGPRYIAECSVGVPLQ